MAIITVITPINASQKVVFDLARSVDILQVTTAKTNETVIAGRTKGLMELGETVTWRAKHFGVFQTLTSKITVLKKHEYFVDEMVSGAFNRFRHEHIFEASERGVIMTDIFDYTSPLGVLGKLADFLFLKKYLTTFLLERNQIIKLLAERKEL